MSREATFRSSLSALSAPTPLWMDEHGACTEGSTGLVRHALPADLGRAVRSVAPDGDYASVIAAAWGLVLARLSGEALVAFGEEDATRSGRGAVPLPLRIDRTASRGDWLLRHKAEWDLLRAAGDTPPERIKEWLGFSADRPLFESMIGPPSEEALRGPLRVPLALLFDETLACFHVRYDPTRFSAATIERLLHFLTTALGQLVTRSEQPPAKAALLTDAELAALADQGAARGTFPVGGSLHELFEAQVRRSPDATAVVCDDERLTYDELNRRANRVAHALRGAGVGPETIVGLLVERSPDLVVGLLGILKAGGGYLPIDPVYPDDRIAFMLEDSAAAMVVSQRPLRARLPASVRVLLVDDKGALDREVASDPRSGTGPESLAYVIYTSGSTGRPKGVQIEHRQAVRLFSSTDAWFHFGPQDVWTLFHSIAFDFSVWELWGALLYGGRLVVVPYVVSRSPESFRELVARERVTVLNQTPAAFRTFMRADESKGAGALALRYVIFGGEALDLPSLRPWFDRHGDELPRLVNMYGITETTVHVTYRPLSRADLLGRSGSVIGGAIPDLSLHVLDEWLRPVPTGVVGELYVGGAGVARGYLNRPELNAERFIASPFRPDERLYKSGDLARRRDDGDLEYLGRIDHQVKIRGFRIELGEIQSQLLRHPDVREAAVLVQEDGSHEKRLVAYLVPPRGRSVPGAAVLRRELAAHLPEYMVPSHFVALERLPLTSNGKLDRVALPPPSRTRPDFGQPFVSPRNETEAALVQIFSEVLEVDPVGADDNFFDLGGTSLLALRAISRIREATGGQVPVARFFQGSSAAAMAQFLTGESVAARTFAKPRRKSGAADDQGSGAIAIIGLAGRFPGASDVNALWTNLCAGVDAISRFTDGELDPSVPAALRGDPAYVKARGVLKNFDHFDAAFFGIPPREAEMTDPQQRLFLEIAWEALESAGYPPEAFPGAIGVFAGMYGNTYLTRNLLSRPELVETTGELQTLILNEKDFVASRVAHRLNLRGPAVSVHAACSTALVAVCQAVTSLRAGQCDMALAGAASLTCPPHSGYLFQEGAMLSRDGHTRSFDASATGTVFSDGAAVVLLKRLDEAVRDRDTVFAVIRGVGINNDGGQRASFSAPSVDGQAAAIAMAHADAEVAPRTISYVEAHGTATPLGDPIEVEALTQAFRRGTDEKGFCAIGSIKSNLGHLVAASGGAGLIKTALALKHRLLPASLHFDAPNPRIDFAGSPFYVNARKRVWEGEGPLRAGVSSFGVGGTNAHVVLEEAPEPEASGPCRTQKLLVLSARSRRSLDEASAALANHLEAEPDANLADVAYTLQVGRRPFPHRRIAVVSGTPDAVVAFRSSESTSASVRAVEGGPPSVVFMFPGQGAQYSAMGLSLYRGDAVFRAVLDRCAEVLNPLLGRDLLATLYPDERAPGEASQALAETSFTQPALFAVEYALSQYWMGLGVRPAALIGHSVGEFVCATLSGVFSLEDGLRLVAARGRLMQALPSGSMLSVRLPAAEVQPRLHPALSIASDNGPSLCVVAGPRDEIGRLSASLEAEGVACRLLSTSHAFHSSMMDPVLEPFGRVVGAVKLSPPRIPFVSTVTGRWIEPGEATDAAYWTRHLRETVRFASAARTLLDGPARLLLEVGPRATLATLVRQQATRGARPAAIPSLSDSSDNEGDALLSAVGQAWLHGVEIDWAAFSADERRRRVPLPTYRFERRRFWVDPRPAVSAVLPPAREERPMEEGLSASPSSQVSRVEEASPSPAVPPVEGARERLVARLAQVFEDVSGCEVTDAETTFLELGLDSLALTQVSLQLQKTFAVKVTFRQLMETYPTLSRLAEFMAQHIPRESTPVPVAATIPVVPSSTTASVAGAVVPSHVRQVIDAQLQLMAQQLALLGAAPAVIAAPSPAERTQGPAANALVTGPPADAPREAGPAASGEEVPAEGMKYDVKKAFGAIARIHTNRGEDLTPHQRARLEGFMERYVKRTRRSKEYTQKHRSHLADPRVVNGFRPALKEIVYQIVIERSQGSRVVDLDGNHYVDALNGFGMSLFGWQPEFVTRAAREQLDRGYEIGPQHPLAGDVARLICEFTGFDRAGFCNTGSEAVMGAMRIARTVTGRSTIAIFSGSYHGIFDEVIVRGTKKLRTVPAAPGIMPSSAQNVLVLDYGTPESLEILKSRADDLAAIMVEPVQSRRPDFRPREFLRELRTLTERSGSVFIFDEVVTGFRAAPGGAQEILGVKGDLATYGKVIGGGFPIGVIAGKRHLMDALDGGSWQYGDDSVPTVGVTYFAGTFVRHPLALAAAKVSLEYLKERGPALQEALNATTTGMAEELNAFFRQVGAPLEIKHFCSVWKTFFLEDHPLGDLLFAMLRDRGVHILDNFPCFLTTAHTPEDIATIVKAFKEAVLEMQEAGFLPAPPPSPGIALDASRPPLPGARLGRDQNGDPAWFVPNPDHPGKYLRLN